MIAGTGEAVAQIGRISEGNLLTLSPLHDSRLRVLRGNFSVRDLDFTIPQVYDTHYSALPGARALYSVAPYTAVTIPERPASLRPDE